MRVITAHVGVPRSQITSSVVRRELIRDRVLPRLTVVGGPHDRDPVDHRRRAWIVLQHVVLPLQLGGVGPEVVPLAEREDVGASSQPGEPAVQALDGDDAVGVERQLGECPVTEEEADPVRMGVGVGDAESRGCRRRSRPRR